MMSVGGVNLFPTQLEELILRVPVLSPHFYAVERSMGKLRRLVDERAR